MTTPTPDEPKPKKKTWPIIAGFVVLVGGCGVLIDAISDDSGETPDSISTGTTSKFDQTWPKNYASTTCSEWNAQMDDHQQFVAAADMLVGARKLDGGKTLPSDALIRNFQGGVTTACIIDTLALAEVGAALYLTEGPRYKP